MSAALALLVPITVYACKTSRQLNRNDDDAYLGGRKSEQPEDDKQNNSISSYTDSSGRSHDHASNHEAISYADADQESF